MSGPFERSAARRRCWRRAICSISAKESIESTYPARNRPLGGGSGWDRPIVVAGTPGETVTIRPADREGPEPLLHLALPRQQYLVFDNLVLDAEGVTLPLKSKAADNGQPPPSHVRLINCEVRNSSGSGIYAAGDDHQFVNCRIHHNGRSKSDHGIHLSGRHNLIQGCEIYFNTGWGALLHNGSFDSAKDEVKHGASENVIRGNRIHDNDLVHEGCCGIGLQTGRKNLVYDNVLWGNGVGVAVNVQSFEQKIFNNTIVGNLGQGIAIGSDMETRENGQITTETHDNVVKNNISIGNRLQNILIFSKTTVADHNTTDGDPLFRDPAGIDYHLRPGSPAIDSGVAIPDVHTDYDGIPRPRAKLTIAAPTSIATKRSCRRQGPIPHRSSPARRFLSTSDLRSTRNKIRSRKNAAMGLHFEVRMLASTFRDGLLCSWLPR